MDISELSRHKKSQLKRIKKILKKSKAYSIYHYGRAIFWKWVYWIGGFTNISLLGLNTVIGVIFDSNENIEFRKLNITKKMNRASELFEILVQ